MNILVDIGNTNLKYTVVDLNTNHDLFNETVKVSTSEICHDWFDEQWHLAKTIIVASVSAITIIESIKQWCLKHNITLVIVESEKQRLGITSGYLKPEQLGVDRWLVLVGSKYLKPNKHLIIIDSGTATTVDILNADGKHLGGWILPGITSMQNSILRDTENVDTQDNVPALSFGHITSVNVSNACWAATVGLITIAKAECKKLNIVIDEIVITGGNGKALSSLVGDKHTVEPQLIFHGLKQYL